MICIVENRDVNTETPEKHWPKAPKPLIKTSEIKTCTSFSLRYCHQGWNSREGQRLPWQSPKAGPVQPRPDYSNLEGEDLHRPGV